MALRQLHQAAKGLQTVLCRLSALLLCGIPVAGDEPAPEKYALLVGVTKYEHAEMNRTELKFPEVDARSLGTFLSNSGYVVDYLLGRSAKRNDVEAALAGLNTRGRDGGVVIIGLFGHGVEAVFQHDGRESMEGCFCPWDTGIRQVKDSNGKPLFDRDGRSPMIEPVPETLVRMSEVLTALRLSAAESRIVFADCCRELPNRPRGRNLGLGASFRAKDLPDNSAVMFGCAPGKMSYERDDWGHGAFTKCLLEELHDMSTEGDVTTGTLGDRVKRKVRSLTGGAEPQDPQPFQVNSLDLQLRNSAPRILTSPFTADEMAKARSAWAEHKKVPSEAVNSIGMKFVLIPPGEFQMGSPENESNRSNDESQQSVRLTKPFYLGLHEVTQNQWKAAMQFEPGLFTRNEDGRDRAKDTDTSQTPIGNVSWNDAVAFCRRLTEHEGKTYRLPTEAEWEYSCRAGTISPYSFGHDASLLSDHAWWCSDSRETTQEVRHAREVGSKRPNWFGLFDMHGNVAEWCMDWYDRQLSEGENPQGNRSGTVRVARGGSFGDSAAQLRSAYRDAHAADFRDPGLGFRVILTIVD
ncbi:MAG: SUMF1/EgtB/PvdO family nonheme iron enzyme [Planctomycetaceae bacterium]|nr:SUMF1/EgtB/PvdO family nonheme iron enzyme [Planctomycetaceae bacterium]